MQGCQDAIRHRRLPTGPQPRARAYARRALEPIACQVILPDWWPVTEEETIDFLKMMAEGAEGIAPLLCNPPYAKGVLTPAKLGRLVQTPPAIKAIELADGEAAWSAQARQHLAGIALFVPGRHLASRRSRPNGCVRSH